ILYFYQEVCTPKKKLGKLNEIAIVLVGSKCDLSTEREVTKKEGKNLAQKWNKDGINTSFFEVSARNNINCIEIFEEIAKLIMIKNPKSIKISNLLEGNEIKYNKKYLIKYEINTLLDVYTLYKNNTEKFFKFLINIDIKSNDRIKFFNIILKYFKINNINSIYFYLWLNEYNLNKYKKLFIENNIISLNDFKSFINL